MSDVVIAAIVTVGGMVFVVVYNEFALRRRKEVFRQKEFFDKFFFVRLKAHQKIMRTIAECRIDKLVPAPGNERLVLETLQEAGKKIHAEAAFNSVLVDQAISDKLFDLAAGCMEAVITISNSEPEESGEIVPSALCGVYALNGELIKLLREKSGVHIIDEEFAKVLNRSKDKRVHKEQEIHG